MPTEQIVRNKSESSLLDLSFYRHLKDTLLHFLSSPGQICLTGLRVGGWGDLTHTYAHTRIETGTYIGR